MQPYRIFLVIQLVSCVVLSYEVGRSSEVSSVQWVVWTERSEKRSLKAISNNWNGDGVLSQRAGVSNCGVGKFFNVKTDRCESCPENTYNAVQYATNCLPCPSGSMTPGSSGLTNMDQCQCSMGMYLDSTRHRCAACPNYSGSFLCPGYLSCQNPDVQQSGWYLIQGQVIGTSSAGSGIYRKCHIKDSCPPRDCDSDVVKCRKGHAGILCFDCDPDYDRRLSDVNSLCTPCGFAFIPVLIFTLSVIGIFIISLILANVSQHELARRVAQFPQRSVVQAKIIFLICQIHLAISIGGLAVNLHFGNMWESEDKIWPFVKYTDIMFSTSLNMGLLVEVPRLGCVSRFSRSSQSLLQKQLLFVVWVPPALCVLTFVLWLCVHLRRIRKAPTVHRGQQVPISIDDWVAFSGLDCTGFCSSMLLWLYVLLAPIMTRYCSLAISCSIGAVLDPRLALAPSLSCEKLNSFMTGIIVVSIGIPVLLIIILIVKHRQLSTVAKAKVRFGALTDGYRDKFAWMSGLKFLLLHMNILTSMIIPDVLIRTKLTIMICVLLFTYATHHLIEPYKTVDIDKPRYNYWRVWQRSVILLILFDLLTPVVLITDQNKMESMGYASSLLSFVLLLIAVSRRNIILTWVCVVLAIPLQWGPIILLFLDILIEDMFQDLWFLSSKVVKCIPPRPKPVDDCRGMFSAVFQLKQRVHHTLGSKAEAAILYSVRITCSPAEALAQLHHIVGNDDLGTLPMEMIANILIEAGHLEIQGPSLLITVPVLQFMFRDISSEIVTVSEFRQQVKLCLDIIAEKLKILDLVKSQEQKAADISRKYSLIKRMVKPKEIKTATNWKDLLDVKRDSDIRTRWLASQKDYRRLEDINRTQADFRYLFPLATPVSATLLSQHETEPDTDTPSETPWLAKLLDFI